MEEKSIKGYKGFDKDLKCRGMQYEVGKDFESSGKIKKCENGLHFCENPMDVFDYYPPSDSRYCEVSGGGEIDGNDEEDSKVSCSKLHISSEIGISGLVKAGVKFIFDKVDWDNKKESNTGDRSTATNTGYQSAATNTGNQSAATNTGDYSAATNTGDYSAATNTGNRSAATNTGDYSAATNTGYRSTATNTGDQSAATNAGYRSAATNTGDRSAAINTGNYSAATVDGNESIAMVTGKDSMAKGSLGCWIVLTERDEEYKIKDVKSFKVDGVNIKADVYYSLIDGVAIESNK